MQPRAELTIDQHIDERGDLVDDNEVSKLVRDFYRDVAQDHLLGPVFNTTANVDWAEHVPKLTSFWCRNLFGTIGYQGNALRSHLAVHRQQAFTHEQFDRWIELFCDAVDAGWRGPNAERTKQMALRIAHVQRTHILQPSDHP